MCGVHLFFVGLKQAEGKSRYGRGFSRYSCQSSIDPGGLHWHPGKKLDDFRADEDIVKSTRKEPIAGVFQSSLGLC
jgi:hypothetical protein